MRKGWKIVDDDNPKVEWTDLPCAPRTPDPIPCRKCGNDDGWTGPIFERTPRVEPDGFYSLERLQYECKTCKYIRYEPTRDEAIHDPRLTLTGPQRIPDRPPPPDPSTDPGTSCGVNLDIWGWLKRRLGLTR